ncbi:hypothetical protein ABMA28_016362 [Loxostege sticticalis]|uniref:Gustatory receptor n=1 Tax=Loxostege sticticalis TaxID=481309 RepID=A0ABD0TCD4_LOXSC
MNLKNVDALAVDILDQDLIRIFQPLHLILKLIGCHRVNINYRFVTAPSINQKLYSCIVWLVHALSFVAYVISCHSILGSATVDSMVQRSFAINGVLNTAVAWHNNFCYGNLNSQLYVKLQRIDRELKLYNTAFLNKMFFVFSVAASLVITASCIAWILLFNFVLATELCLPLFPVLLMSFANCVEMYLLFHLFIFMIIRVITVNNFLRVKLSTYETSKNADKIKEYMTTNVWSLKAKVNAKIDGFQELVYGVHRILDALADVVTLFRFPVLVFASQAFLCNLCLVQCIVDSIKDKVTGGVHIWEVAVLINLALGLLLVFVAIIAGILTSKLEETRTLSLYVKSALNDGTARDHSKQFLALLTKERFEISIYNIFVLGYRLPLQMFAITATYTIVLLQLATL